MSEDLVKDVTDDTFDSEVVESQLPVLVHFWDPGAAHCKQLKVVLEELASQYWGKIRVTKFEYDEGNVCVELQIAYCPTLILFKNGKVKARMKGKLDHEDIVEAMRPHLG
ncbi:thioredoxin family protein [Streptomyces sp. NPDC057245]|uniref:thioredoxin family protein n=1 Tax=Streptomyces sp. NPDC057245 TaxID=3346065 RepID=UPI003624AFE9